MIPTVISRLLELGKLRGKNVAQIGIRMADRDGRKRIEKQGVKIFCAREVFKRGIEAVVNEALDIVQDETDTLYCSFDIDSLDAAYASSTSAPQPGGLTSREVMEAMVMIGQVGLGAGCS